MAAIPAIPAEPRPEVKGTTSNAKLLPETRRVAFPQELMPEADMGTLYPRIDMRG